MEDKIQIQIPPDVKPIYGQEVNISSEIKVSLDEKNKKKPLKTGHVHLIFLDGITKTAVSRIVLDPITAKNLSKHLQNQAEAVIKEVNSKKIPKQVKTQINKKDLVGTQYIG